VTREIITQLELIDGQQRLVTLLVLFRVLERILASKGKKIKLVPPIQFDGNREGIYRFLYELLL
jgi:uncharacterized protein with ParB-like and HNH nuclease domain